MGMPQLSGKNFLSPLTANFFACNVKPEALALLDGNSKENQECFSCVINNKAAKVFHLLRRSGFKRKRNFFSKVTFGTFSIFTTQPGPLFNSPFPAMILIFETLASYWFKLRQRNQKSSSITQVSNHKSLFKGRWKRGKNPFYDILSMRTFKWCSCKASDPSGRTLIITRFSENKLSQITHVSYKANINGASARCELTILFYEWFVSFCQVSAFLTAIDLWFIMYFLFTTLALKVIKTLVADFGFWTLVADFGFWTLVADFGFWTLVADFEFWNLVP